MKATNKISALSLVVEQLTTEKPFDSISVVQCLAREIIGFNKSSDKLIELQKSIEDAKNYKGTRKKTIDNLLKELWSHNITMVTGKGVTKCPIRIALRDALSKESLAEKTVNNILGAVSYALNNKKPYDIHAVTKLAQQKKIDEAVKAEILKGGSELKNAIPPTATTPATTPATPATKNSRRDYMVDTRKIMESLHGATELRRCFNDSDKVYYENILGAISTIMDNLTAMASDKDVAKIIGDMQENDNFDDDNLGIDTELVD